MLNCLTLLFRTDGSLDSALAAAAADADADLGKKVAGLAAAAALSESNPINKPGQKRAMAIFAMERDRPRFDQPGVDSIRHRRSVHVAVYAVRLDRLKRECSPQGGGTAIQDLLGPWETISSSIFCAVKCQVKVTHSFIFSSRNIISHNFTI